MNTHKHMTNREIANLLREIAAAYEIRGENRFRQVAYENAADSIEHEDQELRDLWQEKRLRSVPGIGESMASHLHELFKTGKVKHFESVTRRLPEGMFPLLNLQGVGPKTAFKLAKVLKLTQRGTAIKKLGLAAKAHKIQKIEGFGKESERDLLAATTQKKPKTDRMPLVLAESQSKRILAFMKKEKAVLRIDPLGSLRRRMATIGDVDLAAATKQPEKVLSHFIKYPEKRAILAQGENTARIKLKNNVQIDIKTQTPDRYGALLQHFTGSKAHNVHLREVALKKRLSLSEYGIKRQVTRSTGSGQARHMEQVTRPFATEEAFYKALGMAWIPPELREDTGEIEASLRSAQEHSGGLPTLVELKDIKGDLHCHSDYDWISSHDAGADSMEHLIEKAQGLGYEYLGLSDHNPSVSSYSQRRVTELVKRRKEYIEKLNYSSEKKSAKRTFHVLNLLEVDIQTNGNLSLSNESIRELDFAIVSIHSNLRQNKADMTKRVIEGLSHPKAMILGHPTGRLITGREASELDWDALFSFCIKNDKFLEINSQPSRLDLPDMVVKEAIENGVKLVISTDSHAASQLEHMTLGVAVARRGWAQKRDIINTLPWEKFHDKVMSKK